MDFTTLTQTIESKLGLSTFPQNVKDAIVVKLAENILERSHLTIAETLTEDEAGEVTAMMEGGKIEAAMNFLSEKHPEIDEKIIAISNDVVAEFLEA